MVVSTLAPTPLDPYRIFPAVHNWNDEYTVTLEYLTDIITTGSGKEQRRAVRNSPRVTLEGQGIYSDEAKLLMDYYFASWQPYKALAPLEYLSVRMADAMPPEAQAVDINWTGEDAPPWFSVGQTVILRHALRPGVMETRTIAGVTENAISFSDLSQTEFPHGSKIMAAMEGWGKTQPNASRHSMAAGTIAYTFTGDPLKLPPFPAGGSAINLSGKEVFVTKPNWRENINITFAWDQQPIDYSYGAIGAPVDFDFPTRITKSTYLARDRDEVFALTNFFRRAQGQRASFFSVTYEDDIPYRAIAGGGNAILINGTAFAYTYMDSTVFRRIALRLVDGSLSHHLVDYVEALPSGDSVLWLTDQLPVAELTRATVRGISWVFNSRFATDALALVFRSESVAEYSLAFRSLENFEL